MHRLFVPHLTCKGTLVSTYHTCWGGDLSFLTPVFVLHFTRPHVAAHVNGGRLRWCSRRRLLLLEITAVERSVFTTKHEIFIFVSLIFTSLCNIFKSQVSTCVCVRANMWTHTYCKSNFLLFIRQNVLSCGMNYSNHWSRNKQRQLVLR